MTRKKKGSITRVVKKKKFSETVSMARNWNLELGSLSKSVCVLQDWMKISELADIATTADISNYKATQFCSLLSCSLVYITLCIQPLALRAVNHNFPKELSYRQQPSTLITAQKLILFYSI